MYVFNVIVFLMSKLANLASRQCCGEKCLNHRYDVYCWNYERYKLLSESLLTSFLFASQRNLWKMRNVRKGVIRKQKHEAKKRPSSFVSDFTEFLAIVSRG